MNLNEAFEICVEKARVHMEKLNGKLFEPGETDSGDFYENYPNHDFVSNRWQWLSSMVTGMAPLLYQTVGDKDALKWAYRFAGEYHDKVFAPYTQTMHDIGFLYLPYSVHLYMLTGDTNHRDTALRAADELAKRYNIRGHFIEAWDDMNREKRECRMIVDSSMNVALLYWAWKETGHYFYRDIADAHLETIIKTLVREDYSIAHAWFFDPETGEPKKEANSCGYADGSYWARGTAWVVYGLAMAYSYTKRQDFLDTAVKIGEKYLSSLGESPVPVWDFRLPEDKPAATSNNTRQKMNFIWDETDPKNMVYNVDTSAAAIISCGFMLLDSLGDYPQFGNYAQKALEALSNNYLNPDTKIPGMLKGSNGRNRYTSYGDYYYLLALSMKLYGIDSCWGTLKND